MPLFAAKADAASIDAVAENMWFHRHSVDRNGTATSSESRRAHSDKHHFRRVEGLKVRLLLAANLGI